MEKIIRKGLYTNEVPPKRHEMHFNMALDPLGITTKNHSTLFVYSL